jgi:hypothetical protein
VLSGLTIACSSTGQGSHAPCKPHKHVDAHTLACSHNNTATPAAS